MSTEALTSKFLKDLKMYIFVNHGTQSGYAKKLGVSRAHISAVCLGKKAPTKQILSDVGYSLSKKTVYTFLKNKELSK